MALNSGDYIDGSTKFGTIQKAGESRTINSTALKVLERDADGLIWECTTAATPSSAFNGQAGFTKGCTCVQTDGGSGTTKYINEGTAASASFVAVSSAAATTFVGLSDTPGTITAKVHYRGNAGGTALEAGLRVGTLTPTSGNVLVGDGTDFNSATPNAAGLVALTGAQTIAGVKTFSDTPILGAGATFSGDSLISSAGKMQFRDSGVYINSGADGKITISADGSGADDITLDGAVSASDNITMATDKKLQLRDTGLYIQSSADGKILISSDGTGQDDVTISGTVTLDDDLFTPTNKKFIFRDTGIFINSSADGKLVISSDGSGQDDITLSGKITLDDDLLTPTDKKIIFRDATLFINSSGDGQLDIDADTELEMTSPTVQIVSSTLLNVDAGSVDIDCTLENASAFNVLVAQGSTEVGGSIDLTAGQGFTDKAGGAFNATAGAGTGTGAGGALSITAGAAGATGTGGQLNVTSGAATTGNSGALMLKTGAATTGDSGDITIQTGAVTTGNGGNINLTAAAGAGAGSENGGNIVLTPGAGHGGTDGVVSIVGDVDMTDGKKISFRGAPASSTEYIYSSGAATLDVVAATINLTASTKVDVSGDLEVSDDLDVKGRQVTSTVTTIELDSAGLDASVGNVFKVGATTATKTLGAGGSHNQEITNGVAGQIITIISTDGDWTLEDDGDLRLAGQWAPGANDVIRLISDGTIWYEMGRSNN